MIVTLEDTAYTFHPGARVRHLIARLPKDWQQLLREGRAVITDLDGNVLGEDGALSPGALYRFKILV